MRDRGIGLPSARGEETPWEPGGASGGVDRARLLDAVVRRGAAQGLEALTIDAVAAAAGVTRAEFAERFHSLDDACLAALRRLTDRMYRATVSAQDRAACWSHGVRAGIAAGLDCLSADPANLRFLCEEAPKLGRRAWVHHEQTERRYADRLRIVRECRGGAAPLPPVCYEVMTGAMYAVLRQASAQRRQPTVEELVACVAGMGVTVRPPLALVA